MQEGYCIPTGKKTPGGAGTHTGHVRDTRAHKDTDHTDEPHILTPVNKAQSVRMKLASEQRVRLLIRSCRSADGLAWNPMGITSLFHGCLFCYILW